jgi:S1-C subfamily serine protease
MAKNHIALVLALALPSLTGALWAADGKEESPPIPEAENVRSIAKLRSARVGTAFVILTEGRKAYMLTAAHVVGGNPAEKPDCQVEFGTADRRAPCEVRYTWSSADLAVVYANLEGIPGAVKPLGIREAASWRSTAALSAAPSRPNLF